MNRSELNILIVEDDPIINTDIKSLLEYEGFTIAGIALNISAMNHLSQEGIINIPLVITREIHGIGPAALSRIAPLVFNCVGKGNLLTRNPRARNGDGPDHQISRWRQGYLDRIEVVVDIIEVRTAFENAIATICRHENIEGTGDALG